MSFLKRPLKLEKPDIPGHALVSAIGVSSWLLAPVGLRGYWRMCRLLGRRFEPGDVCVIRLNKDSVFRIDLADPYWNQLIGRFFTYEPDLDSLCRRMRDIDYTFIDGGANFGYWSVLLTSEEFGGKDVVAVEASERTFAILSENNKLNADRFTTVQRAISDATDTKVLFRNYGDHAGARVAGAAAQEDQPPVYEETVLTITIDDIFEEYVADKDKPVVLKLDVEGAEIRALKGASGVLARDPLVVYEDHGKDRACAVSRFVLEELNMLVFHVNNAGNISEMSGIERIQRIKTHRKKGYNFIAVNRDSEFHEIVRRWDKRPNHATETGPAKKSVPVTSQPVVEDAVPNVENNNNDIQSSADRRMQRKGPNVAEIYESGSYWEKNASYHEEDAEFKTSEAIAMLERHNINPKSIIDIGCGSGKHLNLLAGHFDCAGLGVDVSQQAIERANSLHKSDRISFVCDEIQNIDEKFDLAIMFDVFEHVDDYIGMLRDVNNIARSFIFNVPLDMNVNSILRSKYMWARQEVGHIHYFTEPSALATLEYCDYRIIDSSLTNSYVHTVKTKPTLKGVVAFLPRFMTSVISRSLSEKLFGGSSLLVLTGQPPQEAE